MFVRSLALKGFRNYDQLELTLDPGINLFVGDNAQGKTNIIEAIYIGAHGKSFRTRRDQELIRLQSDFAQVNLRFDKGDRSQQLAYHIDAQKKVFKLNGMTLEKRSELIGNLLVIVFSPEDLELIKGSPQERRQFIDRELSSLNRSYLRDLIVYHQYLEQRNDYLKKRTIDETLVTVYDEQLAEHGARIILARRAFIARLSTIAERIQRALTSGEEGLSLSYVTNLSLTDDADYDTIKDGLKSALADQFPSDRQRGYTQRGPHRDDFKIAINGLEVRTYGSQGQVRTAALSLKLSEIEWIEQDTGDSPVLLLDDVLSELDLSRQRDLMQYAEKVQTIITTTDIDLISPHLRKGKAFTVSSGRITQRRSFS